MEICVKISVISIFSLFS